MAKLQKYLFDTDFGTPRIAPVDMGYDEDAMVMEMVEEEPPPPPPPTFSEEELTLAREQAYEQGRQAGHQEAAQSLEQMVGMAMATAAHHLQGLGAAQAADAEEVSRQGAAIAVAMVRKLHPEFTRRFGLEEIEAAVLDCLRHLDRTPKVTIKVAPALTEAVKEKAKGIAEQAHFDGKLGVVGDASLAPGDCRVEWGDGGAERDQSRAWALIDQAVEATLGSLAQREA
ncbi:MAG TPA: FliH/SctL family protein [Magnetospirillaceae bacterium]|nr:FliH/SctL family protein [Magnetospirillaceae bacterium]